MTEYFVAVVIVLVTILLSHLVYQSLQGYFEGESKMTQPGKHRATGLAPTIPDQFAEMVENDNSHNNMWVASHHIYEDFTFDSDTALFTWLKAKSVEAREEAWRRNAGWVIKTPAHTAWIHQLKESISVAEFMDFYLDTHLAELTKG